MQVVALLGFCLMLYKQLDHYNQAQRPTKIDVGE